MLLRSLLTIWLIAGCGIGWFSGYQTVTKPQDSVPAGQEVQQETEPVQERAEEKAKQGAERPPAAQDPLPGDKSNEPTAKPKETAARSSDRATGPSSPIHSTGLGGNLLR